VDDLARSLETEGHEVVARHAGDYAERGVAAAAVAAARAGGPLGAVVHTAGLSPVQASWDRIVCTNIVATEELLQAIEADTTHPLAVVLIASMAAHSAAARPPQPELYALFEDALREDVVERAGPLLEGLAAPGDSHGMAMMAYSYTKYAVMRTAWKRAPIWARANRRIMTISPGVVSTPMGLAEMARNPAARAAADAQPINSITGEDIANTAAFLVSDEARAISGSDILVDGALAASRRFS
jgi:NAD(P)-dependent dehydrogenase (short-subunit alcohol dehydrogenase family)